MQDPRTKERIKAKDAQRHETSRRNEDWETKRERQEKDAQYHLVMTGSIRTYNTIEESSEIIFSSLNIPKKAKAYFKRAKCYFEEKNFEWALADFKEAEKLGHKDHNIKWMVELSERTIATAEKELFEKTYEFIDKKIESQYFEMVDNPTNLQEESLNKILEAIKSVESRGDKYFNLKQFELALEKYKMAVNFIGCADEEFLCNFEKHGFSDFDSKKKAIDEVSVSSCLKLANTFFILKNYEKALKYARHTNEDILFDDKDNVDALCIQAECCFQLKKYAFAEDCIKELKKLAPQDRRVLELDMKIKRKYIEYQEIISDSDKNEKSDYLANVRKGECHYHFQIYGTALASLEKARKLNPTNKDIPKLISEVEKAKEQDEIDSDTDFENESFYSDSDFE